MYVIFLKAKLFLKQKLSASPLAVKLSTNSFILKETSFNHTFQTFSVH